MILANLTGSPTDVDKLGRPTHFDLTLNGGGGSGGMYASSTGSGVVDIAYKGNRATITVNASIFVSGVGNPLRHLPVEHAPCNRPGNQAPSSAWRATRILPAASKPSAASRSRRRKARTPASGRFSISSPSAPRSSPHSVR